MHKQSQNWSGVQYPLNATIQYIQQWPMNSKQQILNICQKVLQSKSNKWADTTAQVIKCWSAKLQPFNPYFEVLSPKDTIFCFHISPKEKTRLLFFQLSSKDPSETNIFWSFTPKEPFLQEFKRIINNFWQKRSFYLKWPLVLLLCHRKTPFLDLLDDTSHRNTLSSELPKGTCIYIRIIRHSQCECPKRVMYRIMHAWSAFADIMHWWIN